MGYTYEEVINRIENTRRFGTLTGCEVSKHMLERLGNPQCGIPFVHIAGTNGKGSTTAFLCSILQQTGKRVGMFTSPHLITFRERIRMNGEYISEEDVTRLGNLLLGMEFDAAPTMFDYCLAMAVLYFKEQQVDIMVMETGIGGRYDSTNALGTPEVAVITKIGLDHTKVLGDTLEQIAGEKAGIIKKGCPVVSAAQQLPVTKVLLKNFREVNLMDTPPSIVHIRQEWEENAKALESAEGAVFYEVSREDLRYAGSIPMQMQGGFQIENAATAALAARIIFHGWILKNMGQKQVQTTEKTLSKEFPQIDEKKALREQLQTKTDNALQKYIQTEREACIDRYIRNGIAATYWKGRMELINNNPFFLIDGAHNAHGVHALAESLAELYPGEKFHFIMGVMADKDYEEMVKELLPLAEDFITVTPESDRALQAKDLAECIRRKGVKAVYAEDMEAVIRPLLPRAGKDMSVSQKADRRNTTIVQQTDGNTRHFRVVDGNTTIIGKMAGETHIYLTSSPHKTIAFGSLYFIGAIEAMLEENRN